MIPQLIGTGAAIGLPYLLHAIAKHRMRKAVDRAGSTVVYNPVSGQPTVVGNPVKTPKGNAILEGAGNIGKGLTGIGLNLAGRGLQGAATTGGALLEGLGAIPASLLQGSAAKRAAYGGTPLDAVASLSEVIGKVAGLGVSMLGNAAGQTINDIAAALKLNQMENALEAKLRQQAADIQAMNLSPSTAGLLARYISAIRSQRI